MSGQTIEAVHGLAAHSYRLGRAVAALIDAGFDVETTPTVRSVFELAVTAHWLAQLGDDAQWAAAAEKKSDDRKMAEALIAAEQIEPRGADELIAMLTEHKDIELPRSSAGANFRQRCEIFTYGPVLYLDFKILCDTVHPSTNLQQSYVVSHDPLVFSDRDQHDGDSGAWLTATNKGLVWAAAAVDMLTEDRPRRGLLDRAAAILGIAAELTLMPLRNSLRVP